MRDKNRNRLFLASLVSLFLVGLKIEQITQETKSKTAHIYMDGGKQMFDIYLVFNSDRRPDLH
jgi:hypothetical protein